MGRGETNAKVSLFGLEKDHRNIANVFQKRKRQSEAKTLPNGTTAKNPAELDTTKPTAVFKPTKGRDWTVSVALPGSIIAKSVILIFSSLALLTHSSAQSHELRTSLCGHIARALSVFCVDEIVVFSDGHAPKKNRAPPYTQRTDLSQDEYTGTSDPDHFLIHLLSYLETPPHLRKLLFPMHANLRTAGTLQSLDLPHHLKPDEWCPYREGVTLPGADEHGTFVEAGLRIPVTVKEQIPQNTRVTLGRVVSAGGAEFRGS